MTKIDRASADVVRASSGISLEHRSVDDSGHGKKEGLIAGGCWLDVGEVRWDDGRRQALC